MVTTESILTSIKKMLGIEEDYTHFDADIIMHINSALNVLQQLGVGPEEGYTIEDKSASWVDFIGDKKTVQMVKSYVYLKTRILFDPPTTGSVMEAFKEQIKEFEWRLNVAVDPEVQNESIP